MSTSIQLEDAINVARQNSLDISADYDGKEGSDGYRVQEDIRLSSRGVILGYLDNTCLGEDFENASDDGNPLANPVKQFGKSSGLSAELLGRVLNSLKTGRLLFGKHPFHHVMDGRLAFIVQRELASGKEVPEPYKTDYGNFEFHPWTSPFLNYSSPRDAVKYGIIIAIPPDFSDRDKN